MRWGPLTLALALWPVFFTTVLVADVLPWMRAVLEAPVR